MAGIVLGTFAAVAMRVVFTIAVSSLLGVPLLALGGGLILFWIALKLLLAEEHTGEDVHSGATLWDAVKTIAIADAIMSLDNVLAIAGASGGDWTLIVVGLLISIPIVVGGSTLIMAIMHKLPILVWGGAALLGWIAAELIVGEQLLQEQVAEIAQSFGVSVPTFAHWSAALGATLVICAGALIKRARASPG
jgi:YjbE family integral membrane protein